MEIKRSRLTTYNLPLLRRWQGSGPGFFARCGWLLELRDSAGLVGYGDCAPLPDHGTETNTEADAGLESALPGLIGLTPEQALKRLPGPGPTPAARCAIESALLDLISKRAAMPLHRWLNPESNSGVKVNASLGVLDDAVPERAKTALKQGYTTLKLKVGISEPQHELTQLQLLCDTLPEAANLRLDANRSWDMTTARSYINQLKGMPIESLEEPLAEPSTEALRQLQRETEITLALDETVSQITIDDLSQLPLRRIILKPMVQGGLIPCLHLGQHARKLGIDAVVTTTVDSATGVWAATQLAAALDSTGQLCHGLGTGEWLQQDLGTGPEIINGTVTIPSTPGLGFTPYS